MQGTNMLTWAADRQVVARWCLAQPALFYIVPLSQWSVLALAFRRGDLAQLWGAHLVPSPMRTTAVG